MAATGVALLVSGTILIVNELVSFRRANCQDTHGEGMGLACGKTLVRRLGGRIECGSALGMGTIFTVFIPRQPPLGAEAPQAPPLQQEYQGMKENV